MGQGASVSVVQSASAVQSARVGQSASKSMRQSASMSIRQSMSTSVRQGHKVRYVRWGVFCSFPFYLYVQMI